MTHRIVVADYSAPRRLHVAQALREQIPKVEVPELPTEPYDPKRDTDHAKLAPLRTNRYDLLIAHIGGNPSGYICLKQFKVHNPSGKAILYTKMESIPLDQFEGLKLANAIFKRSEDDTKVFANDAQFLDLVQRVLKESGITPWVSPFKDTKVLGALFSLLAGVVGLAAKAFA